MKIFVWKTMLEMVGVLKVLLKMCIRDRYLEGCRERYKQIVGTVPEKGSLNAQVVGKVQGTGCLLYTSYLVYMLKGGMYMVNVYRSAGILFLGQQAMFVSVSYTHLDVYKRQI